MKCPICKKSSDKKYFPFCTERCSKIDLYSWFNEDYRIEAVELDEEEVEQLINETEEDDR